MPQKILSLTSEDFLRGIAVSPYYEGGGIFDVASGIDFHRNPGLLGSGFMATQIGSATIDHIPKWILPYPARGKIYVVASKSGTADIYSVSMDDDSVALGQALATSSIRGVNIYKDALLYVNGSQIGKGTINIDTPTYADDWKVNTWDYTGIHPIIIGPNNWCYIADGNVLMGFSAIADAADLAAKLTLSTGVIITCGNHDGTYLILGVSSRPSDFGGVSYADYFSEVIFWDCWSPSFNRKWTIPEGPIRKIKVIGTTVFIFAGANIYVCNYDTSPEIFLGVGSTTNLNCHPDTEADSIDFWQGQLLWGDNDSRYGWKFGSPNKILSKILSNPIIVGSTEKIVCIKGITKSKIYVGATDDLDNPTVYKLYAFKTGNIVATGTTVLIDLKGNWHITALKIKTKTLASGDALTASVQNDAGTDILSDTFTFAADGAVSKKVIKKQGSISPITDQVILDLDFTANVRIKEISLWGIPCPD